MGLTVVAWTEIGRRAGALVLLIAALAAGPGQGRFDLAGLALVLAGLAYALPPRPRAPAGALRPDRVPAVWLPDLIGFLLAGVFLGLPFVIAARQDWPGVPWGLMLFLWPPGLVALAIFVITVRYQCLWVLIGDGDITIAQASGAIRVPMASIAGVRMRETRLPPWVSGALLLSGGVQAKATALLHGGRASHWLVIDRLDGPALTLPADGFAALGALFEAFRRAGIAVDASTSARRHRPLAKRKTT